jgi:phospholipid-binding lipoprotein MlaA
MLKPPARLYQAITPPLVRTGIHHFFDNINLIPTIVNDCLQADRPHAIQDFWRLIINSTLGIGGLFDPASGFQLPHHSNDLGLTFTKWGDHHSPYIVLPFLGPSTIRDGMGMLFDFSVFSIYPYLDNPTLSEGLLGLHYIDKRAELLDSESLMAEAMDKYSFIRDAYLQNRQHANTNESVLDQGLYVDENEP